MLSTPEPQQEMTIPDTTAVRLGTTFKIVRRKSHETDDRRYPSSHPGGVAPHHIPSHRTPHSVTALFSWHELLRTLRGVTSSSGFDVLFASSPFSFFLSQMHWCIRHAVATLSYTTLCWSFVVPKTSVSPHRCAQTSTYTY